MKILVTGTAGFIGAAVAEALLERGEEVIGVDNMSDYYDVSLKQARAWQERLAREVVVGSLAVPSVSKDHASLEQGRLLLVRSRHGRGRLSRGRLRFRDRVEPIRREIGERLPVTARPTDRESIDLAVTSEPEMHEWLVAGHESPRRHELAYLNASAGLDAHQRAEGCE